jgi:hypothetical protein
LPEAEICGDLTGGSDKLAAFDGKEVEMRSFLATFVGGALLATLVSTARADPPPAATAVDADTKAQDSGIPAQPGPGAGVDVGAADETALSAARGPAEEGKKLFNEGHYAEALQRFEKASSFVRAPMYGLMEARSLEKLGRWVEASERYLAVMSMRLAPGTSEVSRQDQTTAAEERKALMARIPTLVVMVRGAGSGATVTLDGKHVATALLGIAFPVDLGPHTLVLTQDKLTKTERFVLKEKEARSIALTIDAAPPSAPPNNALRIAGLVSVALGGAGVAFGAVAGGLALAKRADLDKAGCRAVQIDGAQRFQCAGVASEAQVNEYNSLRDMTTPGFILGGILAAAGVVMVGISPSAPASKAAVNFWIGPAGGGIRATF